jgi:hypothetical protein
MCHTHSITQNCKWIVYERILSDWFLMKFIVQFSGKFKSIFINCMLLLHTPPPIFQHITQQLDPKWTAAAEEALPSCGRQTVVTWCLWRRFVTISKNVFFISFKQALGPLFQNLLPGCKFPFSVTVFAWTASTLYTQGVSWVSFWGD